MFYASRRLESTPRRSGRCRRACLLYTSEGWAIVDNTSGEDWNGVRLAVVSGKPGGGPPYMMPLIPSALYLAARLSCREGVAQRSVTTKTRRLVLCAVLIGAAPIWAYSWFQMAKQIPAYRTELAKRAELRSLFAAFPKSEMGHNSGVDGEQDEFYRVERAFLGQVTRFDYVNFADQHFAGLDSSVLYPLFEQCSVCLLYTSRCV